MQGGAFLRPSRPDLLQNRGTNMADMKFLENAKMGVDKSGLLAYNNVTERSPLTLWSRTIEEMNIKEGSPLTFDFKP